MSAHLEIVETGGATTSACAGIIHLDVDMDDGAATSDSRPIQEA
jgi:hypothetical protein